MKAALRLSWTVALLAGVFGGARALAQEQDPADFRATRTFRLPEARDARSLAESAGGHMAGERWGRALDDLQRMLEEHRGDVLAPNWHAAGPTSRAHPGAAQWAHEQLAGLPERARKLYRDRWGRTAAMALDVALSLADRRALAEVAQRWPITDAAQTAWWALGDLELELGHVEDALFAWQRAAELVAMLELPLPDGAAPRLEVAAAIARSRAARGTGRVNSPLLIPEKGRADLALDSNGPIPHATDATWSLELEHHPFDTRQRADLFNLYPVLVGGRLLLTTSLWVEAVDAYTGASLWRTERPDGWDDLRSSRANELVEALDKTWGLVAPSVGEGIAVAALQIPYAKDVPKDFQNIPIKVSLPERRLFAFDAETGAPLWSHAPPVPWDGEVGTWSMHMSVAGPPVVAGTRVLVPCYRIQGRVELYVACYDLSTGGLLWNTQLVSGQRELNMFGRHEREFCAAPLRIEGGRVIALTQLGLVGALDLYSGRILWETLYEQLPLPSARSYTARRRDVEWRNTAPAVAGGVVLATPTDSEYLTAFRLNDGAALWAVPRSHLSALRSSRSEVNTLIGADAETFYMDGDVVAAWRKPGGLSSSAPPELLWHYQVDDNPMTLNYRPRAVLGSTQVLVPDRGMRLVLNRATGVLESELPWPSEEVGNVVLGEGMFFSLGGGALSGFFDWEVLLARGERDVEERPDDPAAALALARLCARRGAGLSERGFTADSLALLERAANVLEPWLAEDDTRGAAPEAGAELHRVLRSAARARADFADRAGALADLDRAESLAPDRAALRDTLLERAELLEDRDAAGWLETLARLEEQAGDLELSSSAPELRGAPWPAPVGRVDRDPRALESRGPVPPVGLWVLYARADKARAGLRDDLELAALHEALMRYGDFELDGGRTIEEAASERIRLTVAQAPAGTYAPFEKRARAALDAAHELALAGDEGATAALDRVSRLYPAADAAEEARSLLRRAALEAGEWSTVTRTVRASLSPGAPDTEEDARLMALLAEAFGRAGNLDLEVGLLRSIARNWPTLALEDGSTAAERAEALSSAPSDAGLSARNRFDESLVPTIDTPGAFELLGELPASRSSLADPEPRTLVVQRQDELLALRVGWEGVAWRSPAGPQSRLSDNWELFAGRVLYLGEDNQSVEALDGATGLPAWSWRFPGNGDRVTIALSGGSGVAVVVAKDRSRDLYLAYGLDAHTGVELWTLELPAGTFWKEAVCTAGHVAFLPDQRSTTGDVVVADLFVGRVTTTIDPGMRLTHETRKHAWASGDILVLPNFHGERNPERNHLTAWNVATGAQAWRWRFVDEELARVLLVGDETYLELRRRDNSGALWQVMLPLGARRRILELVPEEEFLGLSGTGVFRIPGPFAFLWTVREGARATPLTAVHLPHGARWQHPLPVASDELYRGSMPVPATSETIAVVSYTTRAPERTSAEARHLLFMDLETGELRDKRTLPIEFLHADRMALVGFGERLVLVAGSRARKALIQIWQGESK